MLLKHHTIHEINGKYEELRIQAICRKPVKPATIHAFHTAGIGFFGRSIAFLQLATVKTPLLKFKGFTIAKNVGIHLFCLNIHPMELMMYLGNDLIESVPLQSDQLSRPGYLGQFKRQLKMRYAELLQQHQEPPEFLVINMAPQVAYSAIA